MTKELGDVKKDFVRPHHDSGRWLLIVVLVLAIGFNVALLFAYRKWQQGRTNTEVQSQVQKHVGQYFAMKDSRANENETMDETELH